MMLVVLAVRENTEKTAENDNTEKGSIIAPNIIRIIRIFNPNQFNPIYSRIS